MRRLLLLMFTACDWQHFALMNSIPLHGADNHAVHVYIGVDGLAHGAVNQALQQGNLAGPNWHLAKMVSMFPGTSDASWSRILHTQRINGYEYQYYDPSNDKLHYTGYLGLLAHTVPPLDWSPVDEPEYIKAFDYFGNGYLDSLWKYHATERSFGDSLDAFFYMLAGRGEVDHVVTGYFLEIDVLGHMQARDETMHAFLALNARIKKFKGDHPERQYIFTLLSDHGMDFISAKEDELVAFDEIMRQVGVAPVATFAEGRKTEGLFAVPVIHTRVSYLGLHTEPAMREAVAARCSQSPTTDLVAAPLPSDNDWRWFGVWRAGVQVLRFAYDPQNDTYILPQGLGYGDFGMTVRFSANEDYKTLSDEAAFALSRDGDYPDFLFRIQSAFAPLSVRYPADVLVSFKRPYASIGFQIPGGANAIASAGFHGAIDDLASSGVLLTEERDVPPVVRSDDFLGMFPQLRSHLQERGVALRDDDPNVDLDYDAVP